MFRRKVKEISRRATLTDTENPVNLEELQRAMTIAEQRYPDGVGGNEPSDDGDHQNEILEPEEVAAPKIRRSSKHHHHHQKEQQQQQQHRGRRKSFFSIPHARQHYQRASMPDITHNNKITTTTTRRMSKSSHDSSSNRRKHRRHSAPELDPAKIRQLQSLHEQGMGWTEDLCLLKPKPPQPQQPKQHSHTTTTTTNRNLSLDVADYFGQPQPQPQKHKPSKRSSMPELKINTAKLEKQEGNWSSSRRHSEPPKPQKAKVHVQLEPHPCSPQEKRKQLQALSEEGLGWANLYLQDL